MRKGNIDWARTKRGIYVLEITEARVTNEFTVNTLGTSFNEIVGGVAGPRVVLDFRGVAYLTSAALGLITKFASDVRRTGGKLVLSGLNPQIRDLFKLTRLDTVIDVHNALDDAKLALETWEPEVP